VTVELIDLVRLSPLAEIARAALAPGERAAFLPRAARGAARLLGAAACEIWLDDDGPALGAVHRAPDARPASPDRTALTAALGGVPTRAGAWLCLPLPGDRAPMGVLAAADGERPVDEAAAELVAAVVGLGLAVAGAERFDAEARDQFLALLGHDLRSPLANVRVGAQLARRNLDAGDLDSVRQALTIIEGQSGRLVARLEALLEAIAADGRTLIRLEALDLVALAEAVVGPHRLAAEESGSGTRFVVEAEAGVPRARGDQVQITQVIEQLVENAAKYAAGGHVTLRVAADTDGVRLEVCDDGPGIRPEDVDRVFAPFGRGRGAAGKEGYGLGLYLARNIVNAHGGRLWIARTSRSGTCMALTLPKAEMGDA
jgi:signal transduction histidine kinase